ncbi:MAG: zinc ribbon domain-containing protein [Myxococcota bacterium]
MAADSLVCGNCGYGLRPRPRAPFVKPRYVGDVGDEDRDVRLERLYRCSDCGSHGGRLRRIATTGDGLSRALDFQLHQFVAIACNHCGVVKWYDSEVIEGRSNPRAFVDALFDR